MISSRAPLQYLCASAVAWRLGGGFLVHWLHQRGGRIPGADRERSNAGEARSKTNVILLEHELRKELSSSRAGEGVAPAIERRDTSRVLGAVRLRARAPPKRRLRRRGGATAGPAAFHDAVYLVPPLPFPVFPGLCGSYINPDPFSTHKNHPRTLSHGCSQASMRGSKLERLQAAQWFRRGHFCERRASSAAEFRVERNRAKRGSSCAQKRCS